MKRLIAAPVLLCLLTIPAGLAAQTGQTQLLTVDVEWLSGPAFELYNGTSTLDLTERTDLPPDDRRIVSTRYTEEVLAQNQLAVGVEWNPGEIIAVRLGIRRGVNESVGRFSGGTGGEENIVREMAWTGVSLAGNVRAARMGRASLHLVGGPTWISWDLRKGGSDRDVLARAVSDGAVESVEWSDIGWRNLSFETGFELRVRINERFAVSGHGQLWTVQIDGRDFQEAIRRDLREATGHNTGITFLPSDPAVSVHYGVRVSWSPLMRTRRR